MWATLIASIEQYIKTNGNKEITGQILQDVLKNVVNNVGLLQFKGIADSSMTPPSFNGVCWYLAKQGYYEHFGAKTVTKPIGILYFDGTNWNSYSFGLDSITGKDSTVKILESDTPESLMLGYGSGSVFPTFRMDYMEIASPSGNFLVLSLLSEVTKLGFQLAFKIGANEMYMRNAIDNVWANWSSVNNGTEGKIILEAVSTNTTFIIPANSRGTNMLAIVNSGTPVLSVYYDSDGTNRYLVENEEISGLNLSIPISEYFSTNKTISIDISGGEIDFILEYKTQIV